MNILTMSPKDCLDEVINNLNNCQVYENIQAKTITIKVELDYKITIDFNNKSFSVCYNGITGFGDLSEDEITYIKLRLL